MATSLGVENPLSCNLREAVGKYQESQQLYLEAKPGAAEVWEAFLLEWLDQLPKDCEAEADKAKC